MADQTYGKEKGLLEIGHAGVLGAHILIACATSSFCEEILIATGVCAKRAWSRPVRVSSSQWDGEDREGEEERHHADQWEGSDCDCSDDAEVAHQTRAGWGDAHEGTVDCGKNGAGAEGGTKETSWRENGERPPTGDEGCLLALSRVLWSRSWDGGGSFCQKSVCNCGKLHQLVKR